MEIVALLGKENGPTIVDHVKEQKVQLLVLGHRKRSKACRFWMRWTGRKRRYGLLHTKCQLHDSRSKEEEKKTRRLFDYC